jgi:hypothetical protein
VREVEERLLSLVGCSTEGFSRSQMTSTPPLQSVLMTQFTPRDSFSGTRSTWTKQLPLAAAPPYTDPNYSAFALSTAFCLSLFVVLGFFPEKVLPFGDEKKVRVLVWSPRLGETLEFVRVYALCDVVGGCLRDPKGAITLMESFQPHFTTTHCLCSYSVFHLLTHSITHSITHSFLFVHFNH